MLDWSGQEENSFSILSGVLPAHDTGPGLSREYLGIDGGLSTSGIAILVGQWHPFGSEGGFARWSNKFGQKHELSSLYGGLFFKLRSLAGQKHNSSSLSSWLDSPSLYVCWGIFLRS